MKILDIPQSGKRGITVSQGGRYGQISRSLAIPTNPRTSYQMATRSIFASVNSAWRNLTGAQRLAWTAAAKNYTSKSRCGTSGTLTGSQLHSKIHCTLSQFGQATVQVSVLTIDTTADPRELADGFRVAGSARRDP